ncbi:MAG: (d)CMP kinase [Clostridia bacterium]|nr:(d)CMP kinase [Clostridia bacterium]
MNSTVNIAIDGPAGAGKSTIARRLAAEMGYIYVDTGALYRTVALNVVRHSVESDNTNAIIGLLKDADVNIAYKNGEQRVILNGEDVSELIRTPEISMMASKVSAIPEVRTFLLGLQRKLARENNVVMDGRDIATVVLPEARVKIFLTASAEVRARRRYIELLDKGTEVEFETVLKEMIQRDEQDMNRAVAPLKPSEDSVIVDTSDVDLDGAVRLMREAVESQLKKG